MPSYLKSFKENNVKKVTSPGGPNALTLSKEINVPSATISRWVKTFGSGLMGEKQTKANHRNPIEKFALINELHSLSGSSQGEFLRREGLTDAHLELWEKNLSKSYLLKKTPKKRMRRLLQKDRYKNFRKTLTEKIKLLLKPRCFLYLKKLNLLFGEEEA